MAFAVRDLSDDLASKVRDMSLLPVGPSPSAVTHVEGEELQPFCKVTHFVGPCKESLRLIQEDFDRLGDTGFVLDQLTHGEGIVDGSTKVGMVGLVNCGEQRRQPFALADGLLDWIKSRLI